MNKLIEISKWLEKKLGVEIIELPNSSIAEQIDKFDDTGCGIGLILALEVYSTDDPTDISYTMASYPVMKIRNVWMTIDDDNLSDMVRSMIIMLVPTNEEPNG